MKRYTWLVTYTTADNKVFTKTFVNEHDFFKFIERLDQRIMKGTCLDYDATRLG